FDFKMDIDIEDLDLPAFDFEAFSEALAPQIQVPEEAINEIIEGVMSGFLEDVGDQEFESIEEVLLYFTEYLSSDKLQKEIEEALQELTDSMEIAENTNDVMMAFIEEYMGVVSLEIANEIEANVEEMMTQFENMDEMISIDEAMFRDSFSFNITEEDIFSLIQSLSQRSTTTYTSNLKDLGYHDIDEPTQINLYPKDFSTKEDVIKFIDNYNERMEKENMETKVVKYTDFVGAMMSSVTSIINMISYALIAFVGISLIVSSIMIGVITYVSVLERIKEIGILRAIGASKKDIKRVFNAETLIIGFVAGILGISITYVIATIASSIVYTKKGIPNIATLNPKAALILVLISMFLAFISGLIPASSAAKKDPVEALRSE
ncbi:MAG TPA: FtsX-like permease family protein, partial [Erysipelothrix sp.]|nr:FtsX-like permease family protein [Erysipelothrix sp.]